MQQPFRLALTSLVLCAFASLAGAQSTGISFGDKGQDPDTPVAVSADRFEVNQTDGTALFSGHVDISQGAMRMTAATVRVEYGDKNGAEAGKISRLLASGGVTLASGGEAAESREAVYTIASGKVVMTGDVVVTQGQSAMSGQRLVIDMTTGNGTMEGRVQTVFRPAAPKTSQ